VCRKTAIIRQKTNFVLLLRRSNMTLKYALIGCGRISPNHIAAALENDLEIVALCDVKPENMEDKLQKFDLPKSTNLYTDYKEMLEKEKPELVAICTESGKHAAIALDCIEAGANLIIEKPIALSLEDADEIIKKAKEKNVKVSACHQNRFNKSIQKIREAVEAERFGRLLHGTAHIRWNRGEDYYTQAPWRGTWEQDGGALMNQCIHNIDLLRWMMGGEITEVVGMTDNLKHGFIEAEDLGLALIKFSNGSYGIVEGTTNIFPTNLEETLYIFGDNGTVKAGGKSVNIIEEWLFADNKDNPEEVKAKYQENPPSVYGFGHNPLYTDVIDAIKNDREPYVTAKDGRDALELVLAIYKSAAEGKGVKLPLEKCSTLDFKGRFDK
jgi:UDP-N-acetyl-2-amino-2-deoxyglucuronate dehydrogenase